MLHPIGSIVVHRIDGSTGTVREYHPATPRTPEHYVIEWSDEPGPWAHVPDELIAGDPAIGLADPIPRKP